MEHNLNGVDICITGVTIWQIMNWGDSTWHRNWHNSREVYSIWE
jgi:hypothetical protein